MIRYFNKKSRKIFAVCLILSALFLAGCATNSDLNGQSDEITIVSLIKGAKKKKAEKAKKLESTEPESTDLELNVKKSDVPETAVSENISSESVNSANKKVSDPENTTENTTEGSTEDSTVNSTENLIEDSKQAKKAKRAAEKELARQKKEAEKTRKKAEKEGAKLPEVTFASDPDFAEKTKNQEINTRTGDLAVTEEFEVTGNEWFYSSAARKKVERNLGRIRLFANGKKGTFNISVYDRDAKPLSMLSNNREGTGSSFYLLYGNKMYKLTGVSSVKTAARTTEHGIELSYLIPGKAQVLVNMDICSSSVRRENDMVKISSTIRNLGSPKEVVAENTETEIKESGEKNTKKSALTTAVDKNPDLENDQDNISNNEAEVPVVETEKMALKLVLDTSCGERNNYHFTTSTGEGLKTETQIHYGDETAWVMTGSGGSLFQIILTGGAVTPFESVNIASYDTLSKFSWGTPVNPAKTFGSLSSYNDSAVSYTWKTLDVEYGSETSFQTFIATAVSPETPNGDTFIELSKVHPKILTQTLVVQNNSTNTVSTEMIQENQYSDEYVQRLLDRISELESGAKELKRDELLLLNQELDMILDYLRNN